MNFWPVVLLAGIIAVAFAFWLARDILGQDRGTKAMQEVADLIFEGAMAFLNRQYRTIAILAMVAAVMASACCSARSPTTWARRADLDRLPGRGVLLRGLPASSACSSPCRRTCARRGAAQRSRQGGDDGVPARRRGLRFPGRVP